MTHMKKIITLSVLTSGLLVAGGYKIPEQSLNSMALSDAYVAHTIGADTAFYNPAAMAFMGDKQYVETALTVAHLIEQKYTADYLPSILSGESEAEYLPMLAAFYVAEPMGDLRWGVSLTVPGGLTKRWESAAQKAYAEEFTLQTVDLNPVFSYRVNDQFSIGGGIRLLYAQGVVKSDSSDLFDAGFAPASIKREMEGNTIEFGYNLALLYKPTSDINFAVTYRSNVDLNVEGEANLYFGGVGQQYDAEVTVPIPAALNVAISKTWEEKYTLEFKYERTFWSSYEDLDFNYDRPIQASLVGSFDDPSPREWSDVNSFRLGATIAVNEKTTMLFGAGIDESPVSKEYIGFELPDSDSKVFSMGFRYKQNDQLSWGGSILYSSEESTTLAPGDVDANHNAILNQGGKFTDGGAILATLGLSYEF